MDFVGCEFVLIRYFDTIKSANNKKSRDCNSRLFLRLNAFVFDRLERFKCFEQIVNHIDLIDNRQLFSRVVRTEIQFPATGPIL